MNLQKFIRCKFIKSLSKNTIINAEPYFTPAEKLTTGKKNPSVLKSSNVPWTGCPLILKDILGAPKSRQQLTTSSEFSRCWLMEATALGIRPRQQCAEKDREDGWLLQLQSHCKCRAGWWARRREVSREVGSWVVSALTRMSWNGWGEVMGLLADLEGKWGEIVFMLLGWDWKREGLRDLYPWSTKRTKIWTQTTDWFLLLMQKEKKKNCNQLALSVWMQTEYVRHAYQNHSKRCKAFQKM